MADQDDSGDGHGPRNKKKSTCWSWFNDALFTCCCRGFLNPNGKGSKEYYAELGLSRSASLADVKKAYKKLSLSFHPDKLRQRGETLTPEMQDKFRKIKQAYEVLVDPQRRKVYDALGVNGLTLKEDPASFMQDPSKLQAILAEGDKRAWCTVLSVTVLIVSYILLFPVLFALEVNGQANIHFSFVWMPLWIIYALFWLTVANGEIFV